MRELSSHSVHSPSSNPEYQRPKQRWSSRYALIHLYGCEVLFLTQVLTATLDKFAWKYYTIMLGIYQAEAHITNKDLYRMADEHPMLDTHREHQFKLTGHCLGMLKDKPANSYVIYQSKIRRSNCRGNPGLTYLDQISKYLRLTKQYDSRM